MKALWIRVEAHAIDSIELTRFAEELGIDVVTAFGHYCALGGAIAEHSPDGRIASVPNAALERWGHWSGKAGRFAAAVRAVFQSEAGDFADWLETMGKLIERREKERTRKLRGDSAETPRHEPGNSGATGRNGTERDGTEPPASAFDIQNSNKRSGDLDPERSRARDTANGAGPGSAPPAGARKLTPDDLPPEAIEFVVRHWPRAEGRPARRREVVEQLLATLGTGARYKKTWVRAGSPERLAAKCRLVMAESIRDPDKAIVVLLAKLADTSDVSAVAVDRARAEQATEERQTAAELVRAEAWLTDRPDVESAIDASLEQQGFPAAIADSGDEDNAFAATCRLVMRRSAVLAAWRDAGAPELIAKH